MRAALVAAAPARLAIVDFCLAVSFFAFGAAFRLVVAFLDFLRVAMTQMISTMEYDFQMVRKVFLPTDGLRQSYSIAVDSSR